jgi:hypothetical protein
LPFGGRVPFAHHFGAAMQGAQGAAQQMQQLAEEYSLVSCESTRDLLTKYTTNEIFLMLKECIDRRDLIRFHQILGIFELDFVKVKNQPRDFEEWRQVLIEDIVNAKRDR